MAKRNNAPGNTENQTTRGHSIALIEDMHIEGKYRYRSTIYIEDSTGVLTGQVEVRLSDLELVNSIVKSIKKAINGQDK